MLRQVAEGVLIHQSELLQNNAVANGEGTFTDHNVTDVVVTCV